MQLVTICELLVSDVYGACVMKSRKGTSSLQASFPEPHFYGPF